METFKNKKNIFICSCVCVVIICIIVCFVWEHNNQNVKYDFIEADNNENEVNIKKDFNEPDDKIYVYVLGEVNNSGVIEAQYGDRLKDVIEKAGGFTSEADIEKVNLAYQVEDEQKIVIPNVNSKSSDGDGEKEYISAGAGVDIVEGGSKGAKVNINRATQTELETLSGIGPSMANKIIQYRNKNGKFTNVEELKNVPGIGNSKYEAIKDCVVAR